MMTRMGILASLVLADVVTTTAALQAGGLEYNLVMQGIVSNPAVHMIVKVLAVGLLVVMIEKVGMSFLSWTRSRTETWDTREWYLLFRDRSYCALWALYGGVVLNNVLWFGLCISR